MVRIDFASLAAMLSLSLAWGAGAATVDLSQLVLNGDAAYSTADDILRITPAKNASKGSAFMADPIAFSTDTSFSTRFTFQIYPEGADRIAFLVHSDPRGAAALGPAGISIGYGVPADIPGTPISPSLAVEFDTFFNGGRWGGYPINDPNASHVGINLNASLQSVATGTPSFRLEGEERTAWIDYTPGLLKVYLTDGDTRPSAPLVSYAFDLASLVGDEAYFGFTSATWARNSSHEIHEWRLVINPVPLPAGGALLLTGIGLALCSAGARRMTTSPRA